MGLIMFNILAILFLIIVNLSSHYLYAEGYENNCNNIEKLYNKLHGDNNNENIKLTSDYMGSHTLNQRYAIQRQFSSGAGGASVYWVKDKYDNNKDKVLKIFKPETFSKPFTENNEAREIYLTCLLHQLNNNYFPIFYDFGYTNVDDPRKASDDKKHLFFVMEFIPGQSLAEHAQERGAFIKDATKVINALKDVIKALHRAHSTLGFFHNDLHPGNIMIHRDSNKAKIIDFGLATAKMFYDTDGIDENAAISINIAPKRNYSLVLLNFIKDVRRSSVYILTAMNKAKDIAKSHPHGDDLQFINMMIYGLKNSVGLGKGYQNLKYCHDYASCLE